MKIEFSAAEKAELRSWGLSKAPGHYRRTCPACSPMRRNSRGQCLSVTIYPDHLVATCHHCEASGATYLQDNMTQPFVPPVMERPKRSAVKRLDKARTEEADALLASRGITKETASTFGLVSARAYFRELNGEGEAIAFPYVVKGKTVGHKLRAVAVKDFICDTALSSLFGLQCIDLAESQDILICEGEFDPLSFYEANVLNAVSVPNGSSSFARANDDGTMKAQLGFLFDAREVLDKAARILIATDMDEPGDKLAEELARRIGRHRCWRVSYPEGCKDANDVLLKYGKGKLQECAATASPWPVDGLYEAEKYFGDVIDLFENGFGEKVSTGLSGVDEIFSVAPGLLTVVTGIPGNGKSTFVDQLMVNLSRSKGYVSAICSFENPPAVHIGKLAAMLMQKHFFDTDVYGEKMTRRELDAVMPFIHRHFKFIHQDDGKKATIESVVERIKTAVLRWGVQVVVIDPANYIYRPPNVESETSFIDQMLTDLRLCASLYGIHIFFVAHPTKMQMNADGTYQMPKGYSISGSSAWFSKPDFGLTVHREQDGAVTIANWKTRFDWLGKVGQTKLLYDNVRHCYMSDNWDQNEPMGSGNGF